MTGPLDDPPVAAPPAAAGGPADPRPAVGSAGVAGGPGAEPGVGGAAAGAFVKGFGAESAGTGPPAQLRTTEASAGTAGSPGTRAGTRPAEGATASPAVAGPAGALEKRPTAGPATTGGRAATVERRAVEVVGLLGGLIARLRTPLLAVTLLPVLPAVGLLIAAAVVGTVTPAVVAVVGLVAPVWLTVRRRQLVTALVPADAAVADLKRTFDLAAIGGQLRDNLLRQDGRRLSLRPRALAGSVWRGISTTAAVHGRVTDVPRLAPFFPGRLRGLAFLAIACVVSGIVLTAWLALHLVLAAFAGSGVWSGF